MAVSEAETSKPSHVELVGAPTGTTRVNRWSLRTRNSSGTQGIRSSAMWSRGVEPAPEPMRRKDSAEHLHDHCQPT